MSAEAQQFIASGVADAIGTITLTSAARRNALSHGMMDAISTALLDFQTQDVRVAIIQAEPGAKVWSSGHDIGDVSRYRRRRWTCPGAGSLQKDTPDSVPLDEQGVESAVRLGDGMGLTHQEGPHLDPGALPCPLGGGNQLDAVAKVACKPDIQEIDAGDPLHLGRCEVGGSAEGQGRQYGDLVGGIEAADVHGRVRFGIAQPLGLREDVGKG